MKTINRHFKHDFEELDTLEAGIVLVGSEVKLVKQNKMKLEGSHVKFVQGRPLLVNSEIPPYEHARDDTYDPKRSRQLLLHKKEIIRLRSKMAQGGNLTIVPKSCYTKKGVIKLEIALCRGRKTWQKKKVEKSRDEKRSQQKEMKEWMKGRLW